MKTYLEVIQGLIKARDGGEMYQRDEESEELVLGEE